MNCNETPHAGLSTVVALHPPRVEEEVVAELTLLLAEARSGELVGLAYGACHKDHTVSNRFVGRLSYGTAGALFAVLRRLSQALDDAP